jgi:MerR family transcriptional regulator, light-induced transcriptional regulator
MPSLRSFAEIGSDWHGCGRDAFDIAGIKSRQRLAQRKVAGKGRTLLARTIETEIIPRLMLVHREAGSATTPDADDKYRPSPEDVIGFVRLLLSHDVAVASAYVEAMCQQGAALETIFLDLLAPSARVLGRLWDQDLCDFADVTIALSRMQQLLRELAPAFETETEAAVAVSGRRALLVASPGEQHTFGVFIVQEFFRRAGWRVQGGSLGSSEELLNLVASERFDVVGLSVSNEVMADDFAATIRTVRLAAASRKVRVMVGGRFFLEHPECVAQVGADATAQDGRRAVLRLSSLLRTNVLR